MKKIDILNYFPKSNETWEEILARTATYTSDENIKKIQEVNKDNIDKFKQYCNKNKNYLNNLLKKAYGNYR